MLIAGATSALRLALDALTLLFLLLAVIWQARVSDTPRSEASMSAHDGQEDASTIQGKFMVGYQGWFTCGGDGPDIQPGHHGWRHWIDKPLKDGGRVTFEMWPSTRQYDEDELYELPGLSVIDAATGASRPAKVFSSRNEKTVRRHFRWMKEYEIAGGFLQRFLGGGSFEPHD